MNPKDLLGDLGKKLGLQLLESVEKRPELVQAVAVLLIGQLIAATKAVLSAPEVSK